MPRRSPPPRPELPAVAAPLLLAALAPWIASCSTEGTTAAEASPPPALAPFVDVAAETGLAFRHVNGRAGEFHLPEIMGAGAALLDYDGDGDLDVYLVQGGSLGDPAAGAAPSDRLFRNELARDAHGRPVLRFVDVTVEARLDARGYGMGVATGDYDADGDVDLYVTNFGENQLWRNEGDGTFRDVTAAAGAGDDRWSVAASFVDVDGDRLDDLYVGNYVDMTLATSRVCFDLVRDYCSPSAYRPVPDRLLRNRGDGTFEDVTLRSGLAGAYGSGLGVVTGDFDGDGRADLYVANDGNPNQCWMNRGNGRFEEAALLAGCALNERGEAEAGMGVTAGDVDRDGDEELFVTHLRGETNTLYLNDGSARFTDSTIAFDLAAPSRSHTGFGTAFVDVDNDGWLDIVAVNGAVTAIPELVQRGDRYPYHEPAQLFRSLGGRRFVEEREPGPALAMPGILRGAAFGDVDQDGDVDVVVTECDGPVRLLLNQEGHRRHWLGVRPLGGEPPRLLHGTLVGVARAGEAHLAWRRLRGDGSYASASDPRVLFGLGEADPGPLTVTVVWPQGARERFPAIEPDRWVTLEEGRGEPSR